MLDKWLFTRIDNSALIVFRIIFGALLAIEALGAIFTGWVKRSFIDTEFTFNFIGFGFLQPLPGDGMLWYYAVLGLLGIFVMLGWKYRFSLFMYAVLWSGVYLMQKSSYNNHYYLLMLLCFLMVLVPAHRFFSIDAWKDPSLRQISMPRWVWLLLVLQLWLVYTYAAVAKIYPDWMDGSLPRILMSSKKDYWLVGEFLQQEWVPYAIAWFGFCFDLLIIPLLLLKTTRIPAFLASIFFHLFNSFIFHIGIFPYLSLAFILFFFPAKTVHKYFMRKKPFYDMQEIKVPPYKKLLVIFLFGWFLIQFALPLRHWFIKDDVLWTEEGHRLSWRMMLRSKTGKTQFLVVDKAENDTVYVDQTEYLSPKQRRAIGTKPDMMWQFAQRLEKVYAEKGKDVAVFVHGKLSVNGRPYELFIDPEVDLAAEEWKHFKHHDWILPSPIE